MSAYPLFPEIDGFTPRVPENYTENITTLWWTAEKNIVSKESFYKHYHRYPERRITSLGSKKLDAAPPESMILVARRKDDHRAYEIYVLYPNEPEYKGLIYELDFQNTTPGLFYLNKSWNPKSRPKQSAVLIELLGLFDGVKEKGFIRTLRAGSTGVGYTFESILGIEENNDEWADYKGIEIKTFRSKDLKMTGAEKTNLFLKEPTWIDGLKTMAQRVKNYGYVDKDGRHALYSSVKIQTNSHGLKFELIKPKEMVEIQRISIPIAFYSFASLQKRLDEKLREAVFIAASSRGSDRNEEFHYRTLTYCVNPSVPAFNSLVSSGDIILELRMHIGPSGAVRNHGSAFRVIKNKLPNLFSQITHLRDANT
jgi:hypothetical protein